MFAAILIVLVFLFVYLCVSPTVAELKAKREEAGKVLIQMRDESQKEGFVESAEFDERWDKADTAYLAAQEAEENAIRAEQTAARRSSLTDRLRDDAARIEGLNRGRMRPDYDPSRDPRSRGVTVFPTSGQWSRALKLWASVRSEDFDPTEEDFAVLKLCRVNIHSDTFRLPTGPQVAAMVEEFQDIFLEYHPSRRKRAMREAMAAWNTMTPESGGYVTQPPQIIPQLEVNRLSWGGLLQVATVKQTTTGEDILLPFTDDTAVKGRRIAEDGPLGVENNPKFGLIKWGAYKYTSDIIAATYEMLRDSFFDLEAFIGEIGGMRLGRIQNAEATNGVGASMPRGVAFAAPVGVTTASATAITYDEVIDLEESVDEAYQAGERVGFMMHKNIRKYLRKLKDLNGLPLLELGQETGSRDALNGKPVYINMDMDNAVSSAKTTMLYGDFSKVVIRRVGGSRVVRDPYTQRISNDRDLFAVVEYMDSNIVNAGTAPIKKMLQLT